MLPEKYELNVENRTSTRVRETVEQVNYFCVAAYFVATARCSLQQQ
jgi:hypothetical protein